MGDSVLDDLPAPGDDEVAPGVVHEQVFCPPARKQVDGKTVEDDRAAGGDVLYQGVSKRRASGTAPVDLNLGEVLSDQGECAVLVVTDDQERVGAELAAGRAACPGCGGRLRPWGSGPRRVVRTSSGLEHVRARRAVCPACGVTHLLEPASTLPRMRDSAEVVGAAWQAKVDGAGYRSIAAKLGRPEPTVRRWLRRLASRAGALRAAATDWL